MSTSTPYITAQSLEERFGQGFLLAVTDPTNTGEIDQPKVSRALADAADLIDSYIGKRYVLPVPTVPPSLGRVAADLVRYFLMTDAPGEEVTARYKDGVQWLKNVSTGLVSLGLPEAKAPASATGKVIVDGSRRLFTRRTMRGY
ncbi:DUF1320 domain-containing protein [uncultured Aquitalea sp.]|uniref:gp436 family protein n=1 Tax=uncultured Aquitalea sp. TaxID=540272 RepID=UPI0025DBACDC|nr:DUF1320 domain-containing protein [uncultured Aquitalea sp.]